MFLKLGYEVKRLVRTRIDGLKLGALQTGQWRRLDQREVAILKGEDTTGA
jgi:16S rRNA U516 pseudouridylate synthase RsuA-like enzyme